MPSLRETRESNNAELFRTETRKLMIPAADVACVNGHNSLEHALLILTQSGYTAIPVLDRSGAVKGVINSTLIIKAILGLSGYEVEKLSEKKVEEVMSVDVPKVKESQLFLRPFELSITWPFLCVEDDAGKFVGILTRRTILAQLYQYFRRHRDE